MLDLKMNSKTLLNPNEKLKEIYEGIKDERDLIKAYNIYRKVYKKYINSKKGQIKRL